MLRMGNIMKKKKTLVAFPFFNGGFGDLSSMGSFFWEFVGYFKSYIFLPRKILFLLKLVGGKKLKNPYWEWIAIELRQLHLIFFPHNLLSLKHFCFYSFIFLVLFSLCEACSSFSFFFQKTTKLLSASLLLHPSFNDSSSSYRLLFPSAGFSHRLWRPNDNV